MTIAVKPLDSSFLQSAIELREQVFGKLDVSDYESLNASIQPEIYTQWYLDNRIKHLGYWIAVDTDSKQLSGLIGLYTEDLLDDIAWLGWFCVAPGCRKQNIGSTLLDYVIDQAIKGEKTHLHLYTSNDNEFEVARQLYSKRGFTDYKIQDGNRYYKLTLKEGWNKMFTEEQKQKCIDLFAIKRIYGGGWKTVAHLEETDEEKVKKQFRNLSEYAAIKLGVEANQLSELKEQVSEEIKKIDKLYSNQYSGNSDRKLGFGSFEAFYDWYKKQNDKCYYCHTTSTMLKQLFESEKLKSTKFNETLHIEQLDPKKGYNDSNCRLACSLCNNAKSDLISKSNYEMYFSKCMKEFMNDLYNGKIDNTTF
jgi:ribosomal protein S18 acetylase RimI-like enzyme/5-methylcytosine-specific restriction endonuclease McrA